MLVPEHIDRGDVPVDAPFVVVIGGANIDIHGKSDEPLRGKDSNPGSLHTSAGGVARNVAENLARLGVDSRLVSAVGNDHHGEMLLHLSREAGVDVTNVQEIDSAPTSTYLSVLDDSGDMHVAIADMSVIDHLNAKRLQSMRPTLQQSALLIIDSNLPDDALAWLTSNFEGKPIFADTVSTSKAPRLKPYLSSVHTLKASTIEAEVLTGLDAQTPAQLRELANHLHSQGVERVFITRGEQGVFYSAGESQGRQEPAGGKRKVENAGGAGDAFLAGLAYAWLQDLDLDDSLQFALTAADITLSHAATSSPSLSLAAINRSMEANFLDVSPEVAAAISAGKAVVALESTIISHGMPYPQNVETALLVEEIVRRAGAVPATIAILNGRLKAGLTTEEIEQLGKRGTDVVKCSRRDLPFIVARKEDGATTVAATMIIAAMAGIRVFATGGIGGVHRGVEETMDISADLDELARTNVAVVCAGIKSVLDIGRPLEYIETKGVPVVGFQTDTLPAFFTRESAFPVDYRVESAAEVAAAITTKWEMGLDGGMVVAVPIPEEHALDSDEIDAVIEEALTEMARLGITGKETTPFLLARIADKTVGKSLAANIQLVINNARVAAEIAVERARY